ncbi:N-acetylmuramoyl-L-alanine amidase [Dechloromonas sp. ZY10]|uniref:N-acetylmuramoyl-L-alanine amidase family protein n=1 Tax=Dechloromonas aquae TaxID=2664436 RepID=UPI00352750B2
MIIRPLVVFCLFFLSTVALAAGSRPPPLVAVDVGHGIRDGGAASARGRSEFAFNRDFAEVLATALPAYGVAVRPVNFAGEIGSLVERPRQAGNSDLFISIHHDSISEEYLQEWDWDGEAASYTEHKRGYGIFISAANPEPAISLRCAVAAGRALREAGFVPTPWHGRKHRAADAENGVWYYDNLVVLYRTRLPALLFEAGVIKHREEELELRDPARQQRMAAALARALAGCLLTETPVRE